MGESGGREGMGKLEQQGKQNKGKERENVGEKTA